MQKYIKLLNKISYLNQTNNVYLPNSSINQIELNGKVTINYSYKYNVLNIDFYTHIPQFSMKFDIKTEKEIEKNTKKILNYVTFCFKTRIKNAMQKRPFKME
jgi:hypothetical protein